MRIARGKQACTNQHVGVRLSDQVRLWGPYMSLLFKAHPLFSMNAGLELRFGFASLHNVNQPSKMRDDMPSFFVAAAPR